MKSKITTPALAELSRASRELTALRREAESLHRALSEAGFEMEAAAASVVVNGLRARLHELSESIGRIDLGQSGP